MNISAFTICSRRKRRAKGYSRKIYVLQVGAFQDPQKAVLLKKDLSAKGYTASITSIALESGKTFSRVRVGPYATKKEAETMQSHLKGRGIECVVFPSAKYQQ
jgi:cell division protein FtsN